MELKIEKYCDSCPMIDPVANVHQEAIHAEHPIYGDQLIANTRVTITCRNAERCRNMFNYIHSVPSEDKPDAKTR